MSQNTAKEECVKNFKYIFRNDLFLGKVAFVTGGGTGIGFTIAEVLMRHGCDTVIASRRLDKLQESAATLRAATGRRCLPIQMDVRDKHGGVIVNITATLQVRGQVYQLHAGAAKAAIGGKALRKEYVDNIPIQRVGTREDIANTVVYVCSDAAQLLTGSTVIADGGSWLTNENNLSGIRHIVELYSKM
ncbi:DECR2-like protein [Mya arenaria]|uniref:Peroxisomal 2,4-dienoyl-CoA reductase [(3E)-enoyl-CoA-producing] n=1 Tax=Mya arenaria TaxID=6604 RepID=A0ABY7DNY1_MYAAR|nr:DECR2-like protein [Mya arenaria]